MKKLLWWLLWVGAVGLGVACSTFGGKISTPTSSTMGATITPASPTVALSPKLTHRTIILLQTPTPDSELARYLMGVESKLRHSAKVIPEMALGLVDACDARFIIAFPYREPHRRGGLNLVIVGLPRERDGAVHSGEHEILWHWGDEGLFPEQWLEIYLFDISVDGTIRIQFLMREPDGAWKTGVVSGDCPGDDLQLTGIFPLSNPDDFTLIVTRFSMKAPLDFWLQDGGQLRRYHWEPRTDILLWSTEEVPGKLIAVEWSEDSPDHSGDGMPDMILTWDVSGERIQWIYEADGLEFRFVGEIDAK
ncbi:MAG: hypothetical protein GTO14_22320 [Anaerolineales bacterium]|nr:hypothetical protein [Anaerolineales bacterium]